MKGVPEFMIKKVAKFMILFFGFTVFFLGMGNYFTNNGENLLLLGIGNTTPTPEPIVTPSPTPEETAEEVPAFLDFPKSPLEFLEETLPQATPDPNRAHSPVTEIVQASGKLVSNFYVNDTSGTSLDLVQELQKDLPFDIENYNEPTVLIYHTHTSESYFDAFTGFYYHDSVYRNTDPERNIVTVGKALQDSLAEHGIIAFHDTQIHDSPAYNGAYDRSMEVVDYYLEQYPSIKITIDVHRDSMTTSEGVKYKPTAEIAGRKAAQVMILTGSDPTRELGFTTWNENLIFALKLQEKASTLYPNLMRPIMFCQRVYNMDATNASLIFEVGTEVNTFAEAMYSGELMGNVVAAVLDENE